MGRRKGTLQTPEARAKMSASMVVRWQDPVYRARMLAVARANQPLAAAAAKLACSVLPPRGTKERRQYEKVRVVLGSKAARESIGQAGEGA